MRKLTGLGAIVLGFAGVLLCAVAIAFGWRTAVQTVERIERIAARLDSGLAETDMRLARIESRVNTIRTELNEVRGGAEAIAAENPELPRIRNEIERILNRLVPALDRLEATADSLGTVAAGLRGAADIVNQLNDNPESTVRVRNAADKMNRAAEALQTPRTRVDAMKSTKAVQLTQTLVTLTREVVADSNLLAEGLVAAQEIAVTRERTAETRDTFVFWVYAASVGHTLLWLWGGLGQLCLIGWGRRRISNRVPAAT